VPQREVDSRTRNGEASNGKDFEAGALSARRESTTAKLTALKEALVTDMEERDEH
jgi:hypothetical protein